MQLALIKEGKGSNRYRFLSRAVYTLSADKYKGLRLVLEDITENRKIII